MTIEINVNIKCKQMEGSHKQKELLQIPSCLSYLADKSSEN